MGPIIYPFGKVTSSFSPSRSDFAFATLSAGEEPSFGEEPKHTPFAFVALLLFALPLLFTLQKFVDEVDSGERSQQLPVLIYRA